MNNGAERMRRELMVGMVRAFKNGTLAENIDRIPVEMRPREMQSTRCCIYHDRAVLKYRIMALLGCDCGNEPDETKPLKEYFDEAMNSGKRPDLPMTVCSAGCAGCPDSHIDITSNCMGCFARPCVSTCPKNAISVVKGHARVDYSKCIKCGKCLTVCPFNAIIKTRIPCEDACPVGAIRKNDHGVADIDFTKCIFCGKCFQACPFSAIMERSELMSILEEIKSGKEVVALVAPSGTAQFPGTIEQLFTAISRAGFKDVIEVALGAEMTTGHEAAEFAERVVGNGEKLMTTSCCTAYVELVKRHVPGFLPFVSHTPSPMVYAGEIAKKLHPDATTVFIGPCIAKRWESFHARNIDRVMSFEELGALLAGSGIDIMNCEPWPMPRPACATARNYAHSCGVTEAVLQEIIEKGGFKNKDFKLDNKFIDGVDRRTAGLLKLYLAGKLPANFLEVMSCKGGCCNGPGSLAVK